MASWTRYLCGCKLFRNRQSMIRVCNGIEQKNVLRRLVIAEPESVDNFIFDFHISSGG
jgi:hypothetical protein